MDEKLLEIDEKDQVKGHIYKMTNKIDGKCYVGQTVSHRLNKKKYRPFGYIGRFNDHLSEAKSQTKSGSSYLNNAIRKDGASNFSVELIEICNQCDLDEKEIFYIKEFNTLFPNGYNLTIGGKSARFVRQVFNIEGLLTPGKRGRPFGYKHKESSKQKTKERLQNMSEHLKKIASSEESKARVSKNIKKYYYDNNIEKLSKLELKDPIESYIKPVMNKETGLAHTYQIYIDRNTRYYRKLEMPLEEKYQFLKEVLIKANELKQGKNS